MTEKIKILYIHHGVGIGGAPISLLNLIKNLDKEKFSIKVAVLKRGAHIELFQEAGMEIEIIDAPGFYFSHNETGKKQWYYLPYYLVVLIVWIYTAFFFAPKYLRKQRYDIVHLNSHVLTSWAYAANKLKKKVILHNREAITRGYLGIRYCILKKLIKKNCHYIINISEDNKERLGITKNSTVIYNFISIPDLYRETMNDNDRRTVLFLGGAASIKGFDTVCSCISHLDRGIELWIAGFKKERQSYKIYKISNILKDFLSQKNVRIRKLEKSANVRILGVLTDPYPYIDGCDVLITPFKNPHFSRPAIEAFAFGKPVIGSNIRGMNEIIDHKQNGLLVKVGDAVDLANAINFLCNNPEVAKKMGENGREKAIKIFSPKPNTEKLIDVYEQVYKV